MFEIGVVYRNYNVYTGYMIAVSERDLVKVSADGVKKIRPAKTARDYSPVRSITVEELCDAWKVSLKRFDDAMEGFLHPAPATRTRPKHTLSADGGGQTRTNRPSAAYLLELAKVAMTVRMHLVNI